MDSSAPSAQLPPVSKCPALVGVLGSPGNNLKIHFVRELSDEEDRKVDAHTKVFVANTRRFKLYAILKRNYAEWSKYTTSLLRPQTGLTEDEMNELDRLLSNFLASARSLIDHFKQYHKQTFRRTPSEEKYAEFIGRLESQCWAFAFFQDFRNFVQHCGLPVGLYSRTASRHSVTLKISVNAKWLLENYNGWDKSALTEAHGELDLIDLTQEYFIRLTQDLGKFLAEAFGPSMLDTHNFFAQFAEEVEAAVPGGTMAIAEAHTVEGNNSSTSLKHPPSDFFGSLGITCVPSNQASPSA
jgi:hypothetical protein